MSAASLSGSSFSTSVERRDRAIDEAAAPVVEPEAEQHVGVLDAVEPRPLQQRLMLLNRAADLSLLAIQVAEDEPQLERLGIERARRVRSSSMARSTWLATR